MATLPKSTQAIGFVACLVVTFAAAAVASVASADAGAFYQQLERPGWAPPGWLFAPVWTVLYALMAVAVWLVWREHGTERVRIPLLLFLAQLIANALWTWIFFAWRHGALAFGEILLLDALIVATIVAFWRIRPLAGMLLIPYLLWSGFATALGYEIWQLNPEVLAWSA
jgi:translocator protein